MSASPRPEPSARVRLAREMRCPVCGRALLHVTRRSGEDWLSCNVRRTDRRGACQAHWLDVALPPGATGATLQFLVGSAAARALVRAIAPELAGLALADAQLAALPLVPFGAERPGHVQIVVRSRDAYRWRYEPTETVLRSLGLL